MPECFVCGAVGLSSRSTECAQCGNAFGQQYNDSSSLDVEALQDNGGYERGGAGHNADSGRDQDVGRSSASKSDDSPVFVPYRDVEKGPEHSYTETALAWAVLQQSSDKSNETSRTGYVDVECPQAAGLTLREASKHNTALLRAEARHTSIFAKERGQPRITWIDSTWRQDAGKWHSRTLQGLQPRGGGHKHDARKGNGIEIEERTRPSTLSSAVRTGWAQITVEQRTTTLGWLWCGKDHALLPVPLRTLRVAGLILWLDGSGQLCIPVYKEHDLSRLSKTQIADIFSGLVSSVSPHLSDTPQSSNTQNSDAFYGLASSVSRHLSGTSKSHPRFAYDPKVENHDVDEDEDEEDDDDEDVNEGYADPKTTSSGSTGWVWDPHYQKYRMWYAPENCWVLQDGTRLQPAHLQPTHRDQSQRHLTLHFRALRAS